MLTYTIAVIMSLLMYKYSVEVYRVVFSDHVTVEAEIGQSLTDDVLLATIFIFFATLLHASLTFKVQPGESML